ncbi:lipase family protein [Nostoc sp.]|uniref:lipase family protein n=1 Tax=Nostoc sp. TaxID=1180 RepID=UPI002FF4C881
MTSLLNSNTPIERGERADIAFFDPTSYKEFDPSVAKELTELLQKAYKHFDQVYEAFKETKISPDRTSKPQLDAAYQLKGVFYDEKNFPFGFVASKNSNNDVFIIFRGTKTFAEWFKDANIPLVSYRDGKSQDGKILKVIGNALGLLQSPVEISKVGDFGCVAVGFRQIYVSLRDAMIEALKSCKQSSQIFVTGHSLGGALATLAIPDILSNTHFNKPKQVTLYTFASPRCGDREFAIKFQGTEVRHWRIANTEDFVTMIPFPTGNVFQPASSETPPELDILPEDPEANLGIGGVTGPDRNPNPLFGFIKAMYDRNKRRMPDYAHTGTPVYFTIHAAALERHHNLEEIYMRGILRFLQ